MTESRPPVNDPDGKTPVFLTPPGTNTPPRKNSALLIVLITLCLAGLLVLAIAVVVYLPGKKQVMVPPEQMPVRTSVNNQVSPAPVHDPGKQEAERLLGEWLRYRARAEAENIMAWAPEPYSALLASAADADTHLQQNQFIKAQDRYQQNLHDLEVLLAEKENILAEALNRGQRALENEDSAAAGAAFAIALAIDPENREALYGEVRTGNLDQVLTLYREGLRREKNGDLPGAEQLLQEAVELDGDHDPAADALARVSELINGMRFQQAMGRTMSALDQQDPGNAETALEEAARLRPSDPAVTGASRRLAALKQDLLLQQLQAEAEKAATKERWAEAVKIYSKALALDKQASFATIGRKEAAQREQLNQRIRGIMASPQRLQDEGPLREAQQVLAMAEAIAEPGRVLSAQIMELSKLITDASSTIDVILRSDNLTDVEIYHVGRFRPFLEYQLTLRPGTYTVVGKRPGFRDVRKTLTITAKEAGTRPVFIIRCEEMI